MTSEEVEPTQKSKTVPEPPSTFSSLPDEITENILARVSVWNYPSLSLVSKRFHSLLSSMEIYKTRSQIGSQETCVFVILKMNDHPFERWFSLQTKPNDQNRTKQGVKTGSKQASSGFSVVPIPSSPTDYYSIETFGSDIYVIGGHYTEPSSSVRIFDCRSHTWRDAPNMSVARDDPHTVLLGEKLYVIGGCDIDRYHANWIEVFDLKTESWTALPCPDVDELCNRLRQRDSWYMVDVFQGKIYLVTDDDNEYTYEAKEGTWKLVKEILSFLYDVSVNAWCEIGKLICCCTVSGELMWLCASRVWREIKGLEKLCEHPTRGVKTGDVFALMDCGGKLLVMWYPKSNTRIKRKTIIWYAKITLESRCNGREEVWGNVECVDVLTFPGEYYKWFHCITVSV